MRWTVLAVLLVACVEMPPSGTEIQRAAGEACEERILRALRTPRTAEFDYAAPWVPKEPQPGDSTWIPLTVDHQNLFGALVTTKFTCRVRWGGGKWVVYDLFNMTDFERVEP